MFAGTLGFGGGFVIGAIVGLACWPVGKWLWSKVTSKTGT